MLAATRPMRRAGAGRATKPARRGFGIPIGRIAALALARPGAAALVLMFSAVGAAICVNALWLQSGHHPLPLFRPAPAAPERRAVLPAPPAAPAEIRPRTADVAPTSPKAAAPRPAPAHEKDPIGDLIGQTVQAPIPPARPGHRRPPAKPNPHARPAARSLDSLIERFANASAPGCQHFADVFSSSHAVGAGGCP